MPHGFSPAVARRIEYVEHREDDLYERFGLKAFSGYALSKLLGVSRIRARIDVVYELGAPADDCDLSGAVPPFGVSLDEFLAEHGVKGWLVAYFRNEGASDENPSIGVYVISRDTDELWERQDAVERDFDLCERLVETIVKPLLPDVDRVLTRNYQWRLDSNGMLVHELLTAGGFWTVRVVGADVGVPHLFNFSFESYLKDDRDLVAIKDSDFERGTGPYSRLGDRYRYSRDRLRALIEERGWVACTRCCGTTVRELVDNLVTGGLYDRCAIEDDFEGVLRSLEDRRVSAALDHCDLFERADGSFEVYSRVYSYSADEQARKLREVGMVGVDALVFDHADYMDSVGIIFRLGDVSAKGKVEVLPDGGITGKPVELRSEPYDPWRLYRAWAERVVREDADERAREAAEDKSWCYPGIDCDSCERVDECWPDKSVLSGFES